METESSTAQTWHRRQYNLFPEKDRGSTYERRKNMKLNIKKIYDDRNGRRTGRND